MNNILLSARVLRLPDSNLTEKIQVDLAGLNKKNIIENLLKLKIILYDVGLLNKNLINNNNNKNNKILNVNNNHIWFHN